jgi:hypothetical protein
VRGWGSSGGLGKQRGAGKPRVIPRRAQRNRRPADRHWVGGRGRGLVERVKVLVVMQDLVLVVMHDLAA